MRANVCVISIALLLMGTFCPAKGEIVFDNITGATQIGGGIIADPGHQGGNIVTLASTSRDVTSLDLLLYEFGSGVPGDLTFKVNLWDPTGVPGNLLWTSPIQHASLLNRTPTVFSVAVPGVHVPDTLGWTIEGISNLHSAGVVGTDPVTVGTTIGQMFFSPPSHWEANFFAPNTGGVGFRLFAVPEPATCVLVVVAAAAVFHMRPSRRSFNTVA